MNYACDTRFDEDLFWRGQGAARSDAGMMINDILGSGPKRDIRFRVGRGPGSGNGKTCGRGQHGYYSRSGAPIRLGFQGGTMRFFRRLPRRGFNNKNFKTVWAVLNVVWAMPF